MNEPHAERYLEDGYTHLYFFSDGWDFFILILLSVISTTVVVIASLTLKLYQRPLSAMVLGVCLADLLFYCTKLSYFIWKPSSSLHCKILGVFGVLGLNASVIWGGFFAYAFYIILKTQDSNIVSSRMKYFILIVTIWSAINVTYSAISDFMDYDENQKTCIHRVANVDTDFDYLICITLPIFLSIIASLIWYKLALNRLNALNVVENKTESYVLLVYPGILVFCWTPFLVMHLITLAKDSAPSDLFNGIAIRLAHLQGILDAVVYGQSVRELFVKGMRDKCYKRKSIDRDSSRAETIELERPRGDKDSGTNTSLYQIGSADDDSRRQTLYHY